MENFISALLIFKAILIRVLNENKWKIALITICSTLVAFIYCIIVKPVYSANLIINPPSISEAGSGISGALSGAAALGGGGATMGMFSQQKASPGDISIAIMNTNSFLDLVVDKFELKKKWGINNPWNVRNSLLARVNAVTDPKTGFLLISFNDVDPNFATNVVNYYPVALGQMISNISYTKSSSKVEFYKNQLNSSRTDLDSIENKIKLFVESNGIVAGDQVKVSSDLAVELQAKLVVAQSKLKNISLYATEDNPEYKQIQNEIDSYKAQLDSVNLSGSNQDLVGVPSSVAPRLAQEYASMQRDLLLRQEIYKLIQKQYEANKLDVLSELAPVGVQIIDPAQVPYYKTSPKRFKIIMSAFLISFIGSVLIFSLVYRMKYYK